MRIFGTLVAITMTNPYFFAHGQNECELLSGSLVKPLSFTELAVTYGYQSKEYEVITEDGYILGLFRIRGRRGLPILLMHGLLDTSDTWLLKGHGSLGITLARQGFDVWFGNVRGNSYSRRHIKLDPDRDASFWDFSFHEHGFYDLPAIIDEVLNKTGSPSLNAIGHSQGNMIFYILGSTRPEYNKKINVICALAPICFLNHIGPPLLDLIKISPGLNKLLRNIGENELSGNTPAGKVVKEICNNPVVGYAICGLGFLFPVSGFDIEELPPSFFYVVSQYFPNDSSRKNLYHLAQLALRGKFSNFDYGVEKNLLEYNSKIPPDYDLSKVTMRVVLLAGRNDRISVLADVDMLSKRLPNVANFTIVKRKLMNHADFIWGENMNKYLYPYILNILDKYNKI